MRKYTAEQVRNVARLLDGESRSMLNEYAALLRERESAKAAVTDEMVECACDGFMRVRGIGMHLAWQSMTEETRISYRNAMRPALETVAPMLASARVPDGWRLGDVDVAQGGDMWTAGIDVPVDRRYSGDGIHASAIECHAATKQLAEALRAQVMLAAAPKPEKE
ncbi:MAG TPA: hypothetical protein VN039_02860 [Nitrospira sp.]|nr:hypothetical protein [Nitrospira sp.]